MKKIIEILALTVLLSGCGQDMELAPDCVKAEYLRASDSPCGGPDQILILRGEHNIDALYPEITWTDSLIITTTVPETLRKPGQALYFQPEKGPAYLCQAVYMSYPEVRMLNVSTTDCP